MRISLFGAAVILASGLSVAQAQTPSQQPQPAQQQTQPTETPPPSTAPATTPPQMMQPATTPDGTSTEQAQQAAHHPKQHTMSACQRAIQASVKALDKSQAGPDTIAQAWQHIEKAKQEKGDACKDEAKQAQEML